MAAAGAGASAAGAGAGAATVLPAPFAASLAAAPSDVSLKSLGLAVLGLIFEAVAGDDAGDVLGPAVAELAEYAATLTPRALFDNWAPGSQRHTVPLVLDGSYTPAQAGSAVDGGAVVATASTSKSDKFGPETSLKDVPDSWLAKPDEATSWWQLKLAAPTYVYAADVKWRADAGKCIPESYTVSISTDGSTWAQVGPAILPDNLDKTRMSQQSVVVDAVATYLRVDMKGYAKNTPAEAPASTSSSSASKEKTHGIQRFGLSVPDTLAVHVSPGTTLYDLERMLYDAALVSKSPATVAQALRGLEGVSLATGSLQV